MNKAVIDVGTNSILLLIAKCDQGEIHPILQRFNVTRLGENTQSSGVISEQAMERSISVLQNYFSEIDDKAADEVYVLGTESLRKASNSNDFIERIREKFDWNLQIISGEQEAYYSFIGASNTAPEIDNDRLVVDVGGGSTEIILGSENKIQYAKSIATGVVKIAEQFTMQSRLSISEINSLTSFLKGTFSRLSIPGNATLIGTGGTITTLAAIKEKMTDYDPELINGYSLNLDDLCELFDMLNRLSLDLRRKLPGLVAGREDVIIYGTMIYIVLMRLYNLKTIIASDRGLRFGYLYDLEKNT